MEIKKIDSITIGVRDLARAQRFYADLLGLPELWRMDEQKMAGFGVGDNSATINLREGDAGMELIIQVEDVPAARRTLEGRGVRFDGETSTIPEIGKAAHFHDPDGNELTIMDYSIEHAREATART